MPTPREPAAKKVTRDLSHVPPRDGRFGRPYRISNQTRDTLCNMAAAGDEEELVYEMVNLINSQEYTLAKALEEIEGRLKNVRTALALGRGLNDLGEFQGQTSAADVAIVRRETAYRLLATIFPIDVIAKLRKGEQIVGSNPGAEGAT